MGVGLSPRALRNLAAPPRLTLKAPRWSLPGRLPPAGVPGNGFVSTSQGQPFGSREEERRASSKERQPSPLRSQFLALPSKAVARHTGAAKQKRWLTVLPGPSTGPSSSEETLLNSASLKGVAEKTPQAQTETGRCHHQDPPTHTHTYASFPPSFSSSVNQAATETNLVA